MISIGPVIFFGGEQKNLPETSTPNFEAVRYLLAPSSTECDIPGISFEIRTNTFFITKPRLRGARVSGAAPGETAYTAMSAGSFRARAATHHATNILASESAV